MELCFTILLNISAIVYPSHLPDTTLVKVFIMASGLYEYV